MKRLGVVVALSMAASLLAAFTSAPACLAGGECKAQDHCIPEPNPCRSESCIIIQTGQPCMWNDYCMKDGPGIDWWACRTSVWPWATCSPKCGYAKCAERRYWGQAGDDCGMAGACTDNYRGFAYKLAGPDNICGNSECGQPVWQLGQ